MEEILVRFHNATGMAESDWLRLAPGISILTGKNNVGKSRMLRTIGELPLAVDGPGPYSDVPQVRVVSSTCAVESDVRVRQEGAYALSPSSYRVLTKDGRTQWETAWVPTQAGINLEVGPPGGRKSQTPHGNLTHRNGTPIFRQMTLLEEHDLVLSAISRLVYIPPERPFEAQQAANPLTEPKTDGSDLPQALSYHVSHGTPQSREIQRIIGQMFPEVEKILVPLTAPNIITLMVRDRFANRNISLDDAGTGLARLLHLVSCIVIYKPGRIFLIDEPTTHLHVGSEKVLAEFIRAHPEHDYVIATHSPIFINVIRPERAWLATRNEKGIAIQPVFSAEAGRRLVFQELGVAPGDIAGAERVLFVEGAVDLDVYPILLDKLGWNVIARNCEVIEMHGAAPAAALQKAVDHLASVINISYLVYLDGDKRGAITGDHVKFLPVQEIENVLLRNAEAIRAGFEEILLAEESAVLDNWRKNWDTPRIARVVGDRLRNYPDAKGGSVLSYLAQEMLLTYRPRVHGPAIARAMNVSDIEDLRPEFNLLFE